MIKFLCCCAGIGMLLFFGVEGSLRRLDAWGRASAASAQRVYCDLHKEDCEYLERARKTVEAKERELRSRVRRPLWPKDEPKALTEKEWRALRERGQEL